MLERMKSSPIEFKIKIRETVLWCLNILNDFASEANPENKTVENAFELRKKEFKVNLTFLFSKSIQTVVKSFQKEENFY